MRKVKVHQSLNRQILVLGAEYDLLALLGFTCVLLAIGGQTLLSIISALILWFCLLPVLQKMAKADPYMSKVLMKYLHHKDFYPAHSHPFRGHI